MIAEKKLWGPGLTSGDKTNTKRIDVTDLEPVNSSACDLFTTGERAIGFTMYLIREGISARLIVEGKSLLPIPRSWPYACVEL